MGGYLLHHLLDGTAERGGREAIVAGDTTFSYADLQARTAQLAAQLVASGAKRGDRVAVYLAKSFDECAAIFAASQADCVLVPVNPLLRGNQVRHILEDCGARYLITDAKLLAGIADALDGLDSLATTVVLGGDEKLEGANATRPSPAAIGEDLAAILYTSGSTGRPKGVMLSHRNLLAGTRIVRTFLDIGPDDRLLSVLPFSFDYGLNQLLTSVEQGACLVLLNFRFGDEIVRALAKHRITGFAGVPTIWSILTRAAPSLKRTNLPQLRYITNTGGAVPSTVVADLQTLLGKTRIFLMYGLTEAFRSTFLDPAEIATRPTSIGKAIPECEVFPVTADGQRAKPGETGILVHRGPTVSLGYWNRPEETARVLRPNPLRAAACGGETVCFSGDLVTEDEDGFLYFVGRDDAMIKSAGYRISPSEVEEILMAGDQFRQVAVIGLPDDFSGQKVHAIAVAMNGSADTAGVLKSAARALPSYMLPGAIELVDEIPISPNGKVDYKQLVAERIQ